MFKPAILTLLLTILTLISSQSAFSAAPFNSSAESSSSRSNSANSLFSGNSPEDEFLPVEEAYQLRVEVENERLVLLWQIADEYYLYGHRFKFAVSENGEHLSIDASLPKGKQKTDEYFGEVEVFYHQVMATLPLSAGKKPLSLKVSSQGCADAGLCYPPYQQSFTINRIDLTAIETTPVRKPASQSISAEADDQQTYGLFAILILAAAGGLILNLMPCVFPVLTLKVMSFTGKDPHKTHARMHGLVYTIGVIVSFVGVAALLLALRAGGQAIGWGFHLQSPWFVAILTYLFFTMGLALSGLLEVGSRFMGLGGSLTQQSGYSGTFFTGVLAVVVASPCTAPFMGTALGYAMTQPTAIALSIFAALGFGMASPFLLLAELPSLAKFMPKPGPWMDSFKRFMAFPLYATCVWLLWVIGNQVGSNGMAIVLLGCVLIALAIYLWHERVSTSRWRHIKTALSLIATACAFTLLSSSSLQSHYSAEKASQSLSSNQSWQPYSAEALAQYRQAGEPVFIDVTADWCITCLANEQLVLSRDDIQSSFLENGVHYIKADWTNYDPAITELLHQYKRSGIPLYLLFPRDSSKPAQILPQILTPDIVLSALNTQL